MKKKKIRNKILRELLPGMWGKNKKHVDGILIDLFDEKDLIKFGNYLLSEQREKNISNANKRNVTGADLANWKEVKK